MEDTRLLLVIAAVFAPMALGAITLLFPRENTTARTLTALAGMLISAGAILALVDRDGLAPSPGAAVQGESGLSESERIEAGEVGGAEGAAIESVGFQFAPSVNLNFTFNFDRLGVFFGLLVAGIGALIVLYARGYFGKDPDSLYRFFPTLGLFATAMLGLVLADNMLAMLLFWELTSISSFLLIGWDRENRSAIRLAMQALVVTGFGGVALMGGLILMALTTGEWTLRGAIDVMAEDPGSVAATSMAGWAILLVFLGGATKSAQWPFHFWLPGAMAAPTPVSAYLHSATMVKAGVYLFARMQPALSASEAWTLALIGFGALTMLLGAFLALRSSELKRIFAYTTVSQLGLLICAYGLGGVGEGAGGNLYWPITQILNHAVYKAPLFIIAGAIMHIVGRKNLWTLKGLLWSHPALAVTCLAAGYALAGGPLTLSFIAKEAFLYQIVNAASEQPLFWIVGAMAVLTATFNVAIFVRFLMTFIARDVETTPSSASRGHGDEAHGDEHHAHEGGFWGACIWWPAAAIVAIQYLGGLAPGVFEFLFGGVETHRGSWGHLPGVVYAFSHPGPALYMSLAAMALGAALGVTTFLKGAVVDPHDRIFPVASRALARSGGRLFLALQSGNFRVYAYIVMTALLAMLIPTILLDRGMMGWPDSVSLPADAIGLVIAMTLLSLLVCLTAIVIPVVRSRIVRVLVLGTCGFSVTGLYLLYQAPDLALTQLMFEIISVLLFLLVLRMLPEEAKRWHRSDRVGRAVFGAVVGITIGWIVLQVGGAADERPGVGKLGEWFLAQSYTDTLGVTDGRGGGGNNVVNVILVDFRGYDTLGEITVLAIAIMGVFALISATPAPPSRRKPGEPVDLTRDTPRGPQPSLTSEFFRTSMRLLLPLSLIFAGYVFFKGHNEPGGGFIAGLVASVALAVYRMAEGPGAIRNLLPIRPGTLAVVGLLLALATGIAPMLLPGELAGGFLQSYGGYIPRAGDEPFHLMTTLFFDTAVLLVVVAVSTGIINRLTEELE